MQEVKSSRDNNPWYVLAILVVVYLSLSIDKMVISLVAEPLKREFNLSDTQIGVLSGLAFTLPFGLAALPMGWLVDRVSRRNLLALNVAIWSGLTAAGAIVSSHLQLLAARAVVGVAESPAQPASLSLIADTFPPHRRSTAVSIYHAGAPAGNIITFLLGGWVIAMFGWRDVFLLAGIPGIIIAGLLFFTVKEPKRGAFDAPNAAPLAAKRSLLAEARDIIRAAPFVHAATATMITVSVQFNFLVWIVPFLVRVHHLSVSQAAIYVGLGVGVIQTLGSVIIGPIADRISHGDPARLAFVPALGAVGVAVAGAALLLSPALGWTLGAMALLALLAGFTIGPSYALVLSLAPAANRGAAIALAKLATITLGNTLITLAAGAISDAIGGYDSIRWALLATLALNFWASFHFLRAGKFSRGVSETSVAPTATILP